MGGPGLFDGEDDMGDAGQDFPKHHVDTSKFVILTTSLYSFANRVVFVGDCIHFEAPNIVP